MKRQSKRVFLMFLTLMIFMFTIGQSLVPMIANAQELATTGFVDSFTIDKTTLNYGEQTEIKVNFSDKSGNQMKAGDTLTLTLPPELQGFTSTIPLKNEAGTDFGTVQITTTNVICTFTNVVETLQNIRGNFYFTVRATNVATDQKKDVETNLGTNLDKQTITIAGPTSGGSGSKPFFYKAGDIQPDKADQVRWFLNINLNKEYLSRDIVVSDRLQDGQTLNKDSFRIVVDNRESLSIEEFRQQRYGDIQFNDDGQSFKVVINWNMGSARSFTVSYTSTITESGKSQEFLKNHYEIDYQILYKDSGSESDSAIVRNIDMGGAADGDLPPKGTLRIVKHIDGDKDKVIPNVTFNVYKESGEQIGGTLTTDDKGMVEVPDLVVGNYYVQEIHAPDYLDFDPQAKVSFTMDVNAEKG
ncbi:MAG TPA: hypothetical protein DEA91_21275, partial [Paenibacillus sp.]|nr:hypothetical protein [Paenibacillus sp.]